MMIKSPMVEPLMGKLWMIKFRLMRVLCAFSCALLLTILTTSSRAEEPSIPQTIPFLTYHVGEPYIVEEKDRLGLTYELADLLSRRSDGRYKFEVQPLPRLTLNERLSKDSRVVIPWVNPAWFGDIEQTKYLWSEGYQEDSNSVISSPNKPIEYSGPASLKGLTVAGQEGAKWVGLDPLVEEGSITRVNTRNYWLAMRLVISEKVDVALLPAPMAKFLLAQNRLIGKLHFSGEPHSRFQRHILSKGDKDLHAYLQSQIPYLKTSREWKSIMARYGQ